MSYLVRLAINTQLLYALILFSRNTLDHIDLEMDKAVRAFGSERSASGIWKPSVDVTDRVLIFLKYVSNIVHKSTRIVTNILSSGKYIQAMLLF